MAGRLVKTLCIAIAGTTFGVVLGFYILMLLGAVGA